MSSSPVPKTGKTHIADGNYLLYYKKYKYFNRSLSSLIDSREFFQPVLTPFELEVALNPSREWEPKIVTDFRKLLPGDWSMVLIPCRVDLVL